MDSDATNRNRAQQQRLDGARITKTDTELIAKAIAAGRITRAGGGDAESAGSAAMGSVRFRSEIRGWRRERESRRARGPTRGGWRYRAEQSARLVFARP
jgi:hypothetical protein